jgi:hypothetical protein
MPARPNSPNRADGCGISFIHCSWSHLMSTFDQKYPIRLEADYPETSSRLLALSAILFMFPKMLLLIPHIIILWFVQLAGFVVAIIGFWVVLFTGRYPRGMYEFVLGWLRWQTRISAWLLGLVDRYPPFSLD